MSYARVYQTWNTTGEEGHEQQPQPRAHQAQNRFPSAEQPSPVTAAVPLVELRTHEGYRRRGIQLTTDVDWSAVARWCNGILTEAGDWGVLVLPTGETATLDDWVIHLGPIGMFLVWNPDDAAMLYTPTGHEPGSPS